MKWFSILLIGALLTGCRHAHEAKGSGEVRVSKERAVELAEKAFDKLYPGKRKHYRIEVPVAPSGGEWLILFQGQGDYASPGGMTLISVEEIGGKITIMDGR